MYKFMALLIETGKVVFIRYVGIVLVIQVFVMKIPSAVEFRQCNTVYLPLFLQRLSKLLPCTCCSKLALNVLFPTHINISCVSP